MFFIYLLLWLLFCSKVTLETVLIGSLIAGLVYWFSCRHMRYRPENDVKILRNFWKGLLYILTLVLETIKSNIAVSKIVYSPTIDLEPQIVFFRTDLKSNAAKVMLANSITLTPGTITVALNDDLLCVHALSADMAEGLADSVFVQQLRGFEEPAQEPQTDAENP